MSMFAPPFRYRRLAYVALGVTDVAASTEFYRDIVGLDVTAVEADGTTFLRCSEDHHNIVLVPAPEPQLERIAFELESESDVSSAFDYLSGIGLEPVSVTASDCELLGQGPTLRFLVPELGVRFEFFAGMRSMTEGFGHRLATIDRLGHVVLATPNAVAISAYLCECLNFRVSDYVGDAVAFLRCFPNRFHHSLALVPGPSARLNHVNFMVHDLDDVGRGNNRFRKLGVPIVFGPGRHPPSNSIFLYFLDPDGITLEYSFGMEEFPEVEARAERTLPLGPFALDYWGGEMDPRMGAVGRFADATVNR